MKLLPIVSLLAALGGGIALRSTSAETQQAPAADPLALLEPLVGREWIADMPGGKFTDTQRFDWMYGRKFVRNPHQVRDAAGKVVYEGETIYGYDAAAKQLRWWYFNATGGFLVGTVIEQPDGTLLFEGENHAAPGQTAKVRSSSRIEEEEWISTTWFWRDGEWKVEREMTFTAKE